MESYKLFSKSTSTVKHCFEIEELRAQHQKIIEKRLNKRKFMINVIKVWTNHRVFRVWR